MHRLEYAFTIQVERHHLEAATDESVKMLAMQGVEFSDGGPPATSDDLQVTSAVSCNVVSIVVLTLSGQVPQPIGLGV